MMTKVDRGFGQAPLTERLETLLHVAILQSLYERLMMVVAACQKRCHELSSTTYCKDKDMLRDGLWYSQLRECMEEKWWSRRGF